MSNKENIADFTDVAFGICIRPEGTALVAVRNGRAVIVPVLSSEEYDSLTDEQFRLYASDMRRYIACTPADWRGYPANYKSAIKTTDYVRASIRAQYARRSTVHENK